MWILWSTEIDARRETSPQRLTSLAKLRSTRAKPSHTFSIMFSFRLLSILRQWLASLTGRIKIKLLLRPSFSRISHPCILKTWQFLILSVLCQGGKISKLMFIVTALWWNLSKLVCMFAEVWCSRLATGLSLKLGRVNDFMCHTCLFKCPVTMLIELQKFYSI